MITTYTCPPALRQSDIEPLLWLIQATAQGQIPPEHLMRTLRPTYEAIERNGQPCYDSQEQARLIWDVMWEVEYYTPQENASLDDVMQTVQRSARKLRELAIH